MKSVKSKISALPRNITFRLLTLTMTQTIGLLALRYENERTMCFDMRFERTALYAAEHGFSLISSSLGISRWKNMKQINDCGHRSASHYEGISYWDIKLILLALKHLYYSELILFTFQLISVLQPMLDRLIHRHPFQFYKCH